MKQILKSPVKGKRAGDPDTIWKFDWRKIVPFVSLIALFFGWVILNCHRASSVPQIWQKIDRMDDRWEQRHEDLLYKLLDIKPKKEDNENHD